MPVTTIISPVFDPLTEPKQVDMAQFLHQLCTMGGPDRLNDLRACRVTRLELWKNYSDSDTWEHEVVLAYVQHTDNGLTQSRVFVVDRDSDPKTLFQKSGAVSHPFLGEPSPAIDRIAPFTSGKEAVKKSKNFKCYTVHFIDATNQPHILDLACVVDALHQLAPNYTVFKTMCYWLANNICRLLARQYPYRIEKHKKGAGRWKGNQTLDNLGRLINRPPPGSDALQVAQAITTTDPSVIGPDPGATTSNALIDPPGLDATDTIHFVSSEAVDRYWVKYQECLRAIEAAIAVYVEHQMAAFREAVEREVNELRQNNERMQNVLDRVFQDHPELKDKYTNHDATPE